MHDYLCFYPRFIVYFCEYLSRFLILVFSVLGKRLAGKSIFEMTYFVSSGMSDLNLVNQF